MSDRPDSFRFGLSYGKVVAVHPESWECELLLEEGGATKRALVLGPRLPEISTPTRPQFVVVGYAAHLQGQPVCWPVEARLTNERSDFVYYDEPCAKQANGATLGYRLTVDRTGNFELRSLTDPLRRIRILEQDGKIELSTPGTRFVLKEADKSAELHTDRDTRVSARNAHVTTEQDATIRAGGNANVQAGGTITHEAPTINMKGQVNIDGELNLTGNATVVGNISQVGNQTTVGVITAVSFAQSG